ncbi:MAG: DEAD/DEAH box helicase, partial [Actinomycetales bacterium]
MPEARMSFLDLGLPAPLARALERGGITDPFPIQQATLPDGIAGRDLLARARTGSGKTLAYGLAALSRLNGVPAIPDHPQALVLVPTRELAMQVIDDLSGLAEACGLRIRLVAGGMPYASQVRAIERGVHLLVATPGRLVDLVQRGSVQLDQVRITVLDEADQLADMGFMPVVRQLLDLTKPGGQRLLFSATLDGDVDA